jgi:hypothetical protein
MICKELYKLYILYYDSFSVLKQEQFLEILSTFLKIRESNRNYMPIYQITTGFRNAYIKNMQKHPSSLAALAEIF